MVKMNKRRLMSIVRWLEAGAPYKNGVNGFSMYDFQIDAEKIRGETTATCGTVCCIAGAANQFFHKRKNSLDDREVYPSDGILAFSVLGARAQDVLGLSGEQAYDLFGIDNDRVQDYVTPQIAAKCIRNLIETGEVDWEKAGL